MKLNIGIIFGGTLREREISLAAGIILYQTRAYVSFGFVWFNYKGALYPQATLSIGFDFLGF